MDDLPRDETDETLRRRLSRLAAFECHVLSGTAQSDHMATEWGPQSAGPSAPRADGGLVNDP